MIADARGAAAEHWSGAVSSVIAASHFSTSSPVLATFRTRCLGRDQMPDNTSAVTQPKSRP